MIRVMIADDHPIILSGAEALLRGSRFEVVAKLPDGAAVLAALDEVDPDILILDVQMPGCSGLDVLRILRASADARPVILLTAHIDDASAAEAISLGVNGLVLKDTAPETLLTCLEAVSDGGRWIDENLLQRAADIDAASDADRLRLNSLTPRERAVAELVVQGMRNREVASALGITEGTVKLHLYKVYEKLGVSSRTELVIHAQDLLQR